jgi:hypothetical protein
MRPAIDIVGQSTRLLMLGIVALFQDERGFFWVPQSLQTITQPVSPLETVRVHGVRHTKQYRLSILVCWRNRSFDPAIGTI